MWFGKSAFIVQLWESKFQQVIDEFGRFKNIVHCLDYRRGHHFEFTLNGVKFCDLVREISIEWRFLATVNLLSLDKLPPIAFNDLITLLIRLKLWKILAVIFANSRLIYLIIVV